VVSPNEIRLEESPILAVAWRSGNDIEVARIELSREVSDVFREIAGEHLASLSNQRARVYSPELDIERGEEYATAARGSMNPADPIIALLDTTQTMDPLAANDLPAKSLLLYAFVFEDQAMFVRKANPHVTARTGHVITRMGSSLSRIEDPIFDFDRKIDVVVTEDELWISNATAFEYLFKDDSFLTNNVPKWVGAIASAIPLAPGSDQALLERGVSNMRRRRRLESIAQRGHLSSVTSSKLKREIVRLRLDADLLMVGNKLVVNDDTIEDVLKLLNEDLFIGGLSGNEFEVDKKAPR
jgi:hypothetical protein